jgi:hypothetical protein
LDLFDKIAEKRALKAEFFARNNQLVKNLSKTGSAGGSNYSDTDQIIVLKPNPFSKSYAFEYDTILSVRIDEQVQDVVNTTGKTKEIQKRKGVLTRAIVGTVLMPGVGTVIGAATAKKKTTGSQNSQVTTTQNIERKIIVTRDSPFIDTITMPFSDALFNKLSTILNNRKEATRDFNDGDMDNLLKLKSLLDSGILSQEEYDQKKNQFMK